MSATRRKIKFEAWHLNVLLADQNQLPNFDRATLSFMEQQNSYTLIVDNVPVLCGGSTEQWPGRHVAWAYLNGTTGKHMLWTTRTAREILNGIKGRIEMTVRADFNAGHHWARLLGFEVETPLLKQYGPFGEDHVGYVRFN